VRCRMRFPMPTFATSAIRFGHKVLPRMMYQYAHIVKCYRAWSCIRSRASWPIILFSQEKACIIALEKMDPDEQIFLTVREVAARLHVNVDTARRYARKGEFCDANGNDAAIYRGRSYRIPEGAILEFLKRGVGQKPATTGKPRSVKMKNSKRNTTNEAIDASHPGTR
jgi:hypothetical protein